MSWWRQDVLVAHPTLPFAYRLLQSLDRFVAERCRRGEVMFKGSLAIIFCAIAGVVALPAYGAEDIAARVQVCASCHGQGGKPVDNATPVIWGQQASYLYKELHDYHSGARANPVMASIAKSLSFEDLRAMAEYFAAKTWPTAAAKAAANTPPASLAMCKACHGQNFEGSAAGPRLAGLSSTYLVSAMNSFGDGKRTNNLDMPGFMKAMSKSEREAIARYLSAL
jgi:cytochrome c553